MKIAETWSHSDECSGMYLIEDGTRVHWGEGEGPVQVIRPNGRIEVISDSTHPFMLEMNKAVEEEGMGEMRAMTPAEETYHHLMRNATLDQLTLDFDDDAGENQ